jgi:hypothetical protein
MAFNFQIEKYINDGIQNRLLNSYPLLTSLSVLMGDTEYTRVKIMSLLFKEPGNEVGCLTGLNNVV